ncbi:hypothetical protein [Scytonema sp. NUACC21]
MNDKWRAIVVLCAAILLALHLFVAGALKYLQALSLVFYFSESNKSRDIA